MSYPPLTPYRLPPIGGGLRCSSCGRRIVWIKMESGKSMPCDPPLIYGDGKATLIVVLVDENDNCKEKGNTFVKAPSELIGRVSHFATCPNVKKHRAEKNAGNVRKWK